MTEQDPAIFASHPPDQLLRLINPILRYVLRTPLAGPARQQLMVLSFKGRKSGKQYAVPVSAHRIDGDLYALANAGWKANFSGGAPAEVVHDGSTQAMRGELIKDRAILTDLYHRAAESYGPKKAQRMMGLGFRDPRVPTHEEFSEAIGRLGLAAVRFTPAT